MVDLATSIAGGLGSLFGSIASYESTQAGIGAVNQLTDVGALNVEPYNINGMGYINPISNDLMGSSAASQNIGQARANSTAGPAPAPSNYSTQTSADPVNFEDFAKNYNTSQGAQYLMQTAAAAQDDTAASKGQLLSGANLRAQNTQQMGIANQDLMQQYQAMAAGQQQGWSQSQQSQAQMFGQEMQGYTAQQAAQQQNFQQEETSYQNLYGQEAMGLQAGTAAAGTFAQGARAVGSLYGAQATNAQNASTGIGGALSNIFSGIAGAFK